MAEGAAALIYFKSNADDRNPLVLIGKESVFEFPERPPPHAPDHDPALISVTIGGHLKTRDYLQTYAGDATDATKRLAFERFRTRAREISAARGHRVQFSQLVHNDGHWKTTFRKLHPEPDQIKTGIPKGRREGAETAFANAQRETSEETGFILMEGRAPPEFPVFSFQGYTFFPYPLTPEEHAAVGAKADERMGLRYSELFNLRFVPLETVLNDHDADRIHLNRKSQVALLALSAAMHGRAYAIPGRGGRRRRSSRSSCRKSSPSSRGSRSSRSSRRKSSRRKSSRN